MSTEQLAQALRIAIETLEELQGGCTDSDDGTVEALTVWCPEVIEQCRAALAQLEAQQAEQQSTDKLAPCPFCGDKEPVYGEPPRTPLTFDAAIDAARAKDQP